MFTYVGEWLNEDGSFSRDYHALLYSGGPLPNLPWGEEMFDAIVVVCDGAQIERVADELSEAVSRANTDWVQTTGLQAKWLHDLIDQTSVRVGRQQAVGDGSPMTSWHEDAITVAEMCEVAIHCVGGCDHVLVIAVGTREAFDEVVATLRQRLAEIHGESRL